MTFTFTFARFTFVVLLCDPSLQSLHAPRAPTTHTWAAPRGAGVGVHPAGGRSWLHGRFVTNFVAWFALSNVFSLAA